MPSPENTNKPPIILLKTKSTPHDNYSDYFHHPTSNYTPTFIPVLSHNFHTERLRSIRELFTSGQLLPSQKNDRKYGGLIFTSQRAVEGFGRVLAELDNDISALNTLVTSSQNLPIYTVGPATSRSLTTIVQKYLPHASIHGADTGNGEALAKYILEHYNSLYTTTTTTTSSNPNGEDDVYNKHKPPLLFLVGEQRRDIIPRTLMNPDLPPGEGVGVDEVVVYETGVMEGFEESFRGVVEREKAVMKNNTTTEEGKGRVVWTVVFSPTGCEGMLRGLGYLDDKDGCGWGKVDGERRRRFFVATIGPTTRDYLRREFGFEADVCAEKPSPEGVGEGIERFMREMKTSS
ncbi:uroporphyrinogen-III synthase HEM4 [Aspergillus vadensis CBS 113365]|uniref:Tetrapyrrole biosynthesis, uroporphyrinogen III synthase n=1 Tax=Aspergillus vadensis (strain CBS 113365 / IMI 142717 / IBT 24658) TaxID=1448311 RepID=A0A319BDF8_ASPVC|nr:tetrapyrrole biosynthesis, uroporphyrinogen III synthase [Aspergillus vadensis CBS 113365]PYH70697.1 tetrapyrrole biosynthesis, uroporphyrinogen III synthase [Aspergillus vadensis CBS 113365]